MKERERAAAEEREALDRLREDLERKKEIISGMEVKLKAQVQEVEDLRKVNPHHIFQVEERTLVFSLILSFAGCFREAQGGGASLAGGKECGG